MSRKFVGALIAILVIVFGITPNFLGKAAEKGLRAALESPGLAEFVAIEILSYERGWFSSEVELSISPAGFMESYLETIANAMDTQRAKLAGEQGVDDGNPAAQTENWLSAAFPYAEKVTLSHGPLFLTGKPGFGIGRVYQEFDFVEFIQQKLLSSDLTDSATSTKVELTGGSAIIRSAITLGFDGLISTRSKTSSGAFRIEGESRQVSIEWDGASSSMRIDPANAQIETIASYGPATINVGSGSNGGNGANITIAAIKFSMQGEFRSIWSYIGDFELAWGGFSVDSDDGQVVRLTDLTSASSQTESAENSALTDTTGYLRLSEFIVESETENIHVGPINMDFSYKNMDMTAYGEMMERVMTLQGKAQPNGQLNLAEMDLIMEDISRFLIAGPEFEMAPISIVTGSGDMEAALHFGVTPGTVFTENDNFQGALAGTTGDFSATVEEGLAVVWARSAAKQQLALANPGAPPDEAQIEAVADQILAAYTNMGLIKKDGQKYLIDVKLNDGKVFVSGNMMFDLAQQAAGAGGL